MLLLQVKFRRCAAAQRPPRLDTLDRMWPQRQSTPAPTVEAVRKHARILVIDDHELPAQTSFERDGYHFERWAEVKNLSQLTDGHYHLILLDIQGVGLNESPDLQGLGILRHVKQANPAQPVIVYSSQPTKVSYREHLALADAVLDKGMSYVEYKEHVDAILVHRATPGYFIAAMNRDLGANAALAPKAVPKALRAMRRGKTASLENYLRSNLPDPKQVDRVVRIVGVGIQAIRVITS